MADLLDLLGQVTEEGGSTVRGRVVGDADVVDVGSRVGGIGERADGAKAVGFVVVT